MKKGIFESIDVVSLAVSSELGADLHLRILKICSESSRNLSYYHFSSSRSI